MARKRTLNQVKALTGLVSETFDLSETGRMIVDTLSTCRDALSVKEIVKRVRRSERSVRNALKSLVSKDLLQRRVSVTKAKRLAYFYTLGPMERIVKVTRKKMLDELERLERLEGLLQGTLKKRYTGKDSPG